MSMPTESEIKYDVMPHPGQHPEHGAALPEHHQGTEQAPKPSVSAGEHAAPAESRAAEPHPLPPLHEVLNANPAARPETKSPSSEKKNVEMLLNGLAAFESGKLDAADAMQQIREDAAPAGPDQMAA